MFRNLMMAYVAQASSEPIAVTINASFSFTAGTSLTITPKVTISNNINVGSSGSRYLTVTMYINGTTNTTSISLPSSSTIAAGTYTGSSRSFSASQFGGTSIGTSSSTSQGGNIGSFTVYISSVTMPSTLTNLSNYIFTINKGSSQRFYIYDY